MNLLDENNFVENKNGHVIESQLAGLKNQTNIWFDLLLVVGAFVLAGFVKLLTNEIPWIVILVIVSVPILIWLSLRLPALIKYYFLVLPDARGNNIAHTTAKLDYHNGYILQAEEVKLSLLDDKNNGLVAGNIYEVFYLLRAKVAISARVQQNIGESQQAQEFTLFFGKVIGFTEGDLAANRNGEFPSAQRFKILLKNWLWVLVIAVIIAYILWQVLPMWLPPTFIDDAIFFTIINFGLMVFILGALYLSMFGVKGVFTALLGKKIEQVEGVGNISCRSSGVGKSQRTYYVLEIPRFSLEVSKRVYDVLVDGLYYRIFYVPRTKYLLSVEVLKLPGENEQLVGRLPYKLSAIDIGDKDMAADKANSALDQRIDREFPPETREKARSALNRLTLINKDIVQNRILALAKGDAAIAEDLVKKVEKEDDYREALMFLQ